MPQNIIVPEQVNTGRQLEVDLAKTLAILSMILVHLSESYYNEASFFTPPQLAFAKVVEFCGGPLSAPVFMTAMGVGLAYSRNQDPAQNAKRGLWLILQGYLLNIFRATLPLLVLYYLTRGDGILAKAWLDTFDLDILQFAGMAFLFFALARLWRLADWQLALVAFAFLCVEWVTRPLYPQPSAVGTIPGFFLFQNHTTSFPLFGWLAYPVTGYLFGKLLRHVVDKGRFYGILLPASLVAFLLFSIALNASGYNVPGIYLDDEYYKQDPVKFAWIILICFAWFGILYYVSLPLRNTRVKKFIEYVSARLNDIYIVQWILIQWISLFFITRLDTYNLQFFALFVGITVCSVLSVYIKERVSKR